MSPNSDDNEFVPVFETTGGFHDGIRWVIRADIDQGDMVSIHESTHDSIHKQTCFGFAQALVAQCMVIPSHVFSPTEVRVFRNRLTEGSRLAHELAATYLGVASFSHEEQVSILTELRANSGQYFADFYLRAATLIERFSPSGFVRYNIAQTVFFLAFQSQKLWVMVEAFEQGHLEVSEEALPSNRIPDLEETLKNLPDRFFSTLAADNLDQETLSLLLDEEAWRHLPRATLHNVERDLIGIFERALCAETPHAFITDIHERHTFFDRLCQAVELHFEVQIERHFYDTPWDTPFLSSLFTDEIVFPKSSANLKTLPANDLSTVLSQLYVGSAASLYILFAYHVQGEFAYVVTTSEDGVHHQFDFDGSFARAASSFGECISDSSHLPAENRPVYHTTIFSSEPSTFAMVDDVVGGIYHDSAEWATAYKGEATSSIFAYVTGSFEFWVQRVFDTGESLGFVPITIADEGRILARYFLFVWRFKDCSALWMKLLKEPAFNAILEACENESKSLQDLGDQVEPIAVFRHLVLTVPRF